MPNNKGFITSQALAQVFAVITLMLIVFLGYRGIKAFNDSADDSLLRSFETGFHADTNSISVKRGSVKELAYNVPAGYETICAFDLHNNSNSTPIFLKDYPDIFDSLKDETENVFLLGKGRFYAFKSEIIRIKTHPHYYCSQIMGGKISFAIKGAVIDGQPSAQVMTSSTIKNTIPRDVQEDTYMVSSDNMLYIHIPAGTTITTPSGDDPVTLSVSVVGRLADSEEYLLEPAGTTFSPKITIGVVTLPCNDYSYYQYEFGNNTYNSTTCQDWHVIYDVDKI